MKKALAFILMGGLLLTGCGDTSVQQETSAVTSSETKISVTESSVTDLSVTEADVSEEVKDGFVLIGGTQYEVGSEELYLCVTKLTESDIENLLKMENLTDLTLTETALSDMDFLTGLPNLKTLTVYFGNIEDCSALGNMTTLETLRIRATVVRDYSPFAGLADTGVTELDSGESSIDDLTPLSGLTGLEKLYLDHSDLPEDLSPLCSLTNLEILDLSYTNVADVTALSGMTNLEKLDLSYTDAAEEDIEALRQALPDCEIFFE